MLQPYAGGCIMGLLAETGKQFLTPIMPRIKNCRPVKLVKRKKFLLLYSASDIIDKISFNGWSYFGS